MGEASSARFRDLYLSGTANATTGSFTGAITSVGITSNTNGIKLQSLDTSVNSGESIGDIEFSSSDSSTGGSGVQAKISAVADNGFGTAYALSFATGSSANPQERARITSGGNLLVGKTATGIGTAGIELTHDNVILGTRSEGVTQYLNRLTSAGKIIEYQLDGTPKGNISVSAFGMGFGGGTRSSDFFITVSYTHLTLPTKA